MGLKYLRSVFYNRYKNELTASQAKPHICFSMKEAPDDILNSFEFGGDICSSVPS